MPLTTPKWNQTNDPYGYLPDLFILPDTELRYCRRLNFGKFWLLEPLATQVPTRNAVDTVRPKLLSYKILKTETLSTHENLSTHTVQCVSYLSEIHILTKNQLLDFNTVTQYDHYHRIRHSDYRIGFTFHMILASYTLIELIVVSSTSLIKS